MGNTRPISATSAGFLFALASAALFAIRPIFVKLAYAEGMDSTTLIAFRMFFSAPIYLALLLFLLRAPENRARLSIKPVLMTCVIGAMGYYVASFLDLIGLQYVSAQLGRMVLYVYPTFVVLLGALFFAEKITIKIIISLLVTYFGVAIIFGHDLSEFGADVVTGSAFILASALIFSLYLLFAKDLINTLGSRVFTCIALLSASTGIFIHYPLTHSVTEPNVTPTGLAWVLIIAIFCTVIPTFFTTSALARIGAERTGIIAMVGPAFTSSFAVLILGESFTIFHFAGIVMIVFGVWILRRK